MKKENVYKIYVLKCPLEDKIRYVGVTVNLLSARLSQHLHDARKNRGNYKVHWLKTLINKNIKPTIELIETCDENNWQEREKWWINYYKSENLTNTREGGNGVIVDRDKTSIQKSAEGHYKAVVQLDLYGKYIKTWTNIKQASLELSVSKTGIGNVLHKRSKSAGGFIWVTLDEYDTNHNYKVSNIKKVLKMQQDLKGCPIKIILISNKELIFDNQTKAAEYFGVTLFDITDCVAKGIPHKFKDIFKTIEKL